MNSKMLIGWVVALASVNLGLSGVLHVNVIEAILGTGTITTVVYGLIGVAGLAKLYNMTMGKK